jgi:primosomal protein N' (replication factor Y) (superfamily II helicase)
MSLYADVVFVLPLARAFTYSIPEELRDRVRPGQRILAPLQARPAEGFVVRTHNQAPAVQAKPILSLVDQGPVVPPDILDLTDRLSRRFLSSRGEMLRTAVPPPAPSPRKTARKPRRKVAEPEVPLQMGLDFRVDERTAEAIRILTAGLAAGSFAPFLLVGPAGRRTAAVLAVCGDVLAGGRSVLALYPEVGMSGAVAEAFAGRLGERTVILRGGMSGPARVRVRNRIAAAGPCVVAGPRSTIFIPLPNLGLIVVEEEADESYRQAESPAYDARDGAWMRAEAAGVPLVLAGDAPRVETYEKARRGGWLVEIPGPAPRAAEIVDDRGQRGLLSKPVTARIGAALAAGRRVLVFTRRKGYASFLFCPRCGHVPACSRCGATLSLGGQPRLLQCRRCALPAAMLSACPSCGARVVEPRGPGVEALEEELKRLFPAARIAGFDSDRVRTASAREAVLSRFASGEIDILAGSPLLAHQPAVASASLAVLLNPEGTLGLADYRAAERLYGEIRRPLKLLDEADPEASSIIQTSWPDHFALRAAASGDYPAFFEEEIFRRRSMGDPPFAALAEIVLSAKDARTLGRASRETVDRLRAADRRLDILGPSESFPPGGMRSAQIVVRAEDPEILDGALAEALRDVTVRKSVIRAG